MIYNIIHSILREAQNLNAYGLFSFLLFFTFFIGVLVWCLMLKKNHLNHMSDLPLDDGGRNGVSTDKIQSEKL